jgi:translocation protein SEC63
MSTARNWLSPTLAIMRLHTYLAQALPPVSNSIRYHRLAQLPGMDPDKVKNLVAHSTEGLEVEDFIHLLEKKDNQSVEEVKKALEVWGRLELVDASFKGKSFSVAFLHFNTSSFKKSQLLANGLLHRRPSCI